MGNGEATITLNVDGEEPAKLGADNGAAQLILGRGGSSSSFLRGRLFNKAISREHLLVEVLSGTAPPRVRLTVVGANPVMVIRGSQQRQASKALSHGESAVLEPGDAFRFCRGFEYSIRISTPIRTTDKPQEKEGTQGSDDQLHVEEVIQGCDNITTKNGGSNSSRDTGTSSAIGVGHANVQPPEKHESVKVEFDEKPGNQASVVDSAEVVRVGKGQPSSEDATTIGAAMLSRSELFLASDAGQDLEKSLNCSGSAMSAGESVAAAAMYEKEGLSADGDISLPAQGETKVKQEACEDDQGRSEEQSGNNAAAPATATNVEASSSRQMVPSNMVDIKGAISVDGGANVRRAPDVGFKNDGTPAKRVRMLHMEEDASRPVDECETAPPPLQTPEQTVLSGRDWLSAMSIMTSRKTVIPLEVSLHPEGAYQALEPKPVQSPNTHTYASRTPTGAMHNPLACDEDIVDTLSGFVGDQEYLFFAVVCRGWKEAWGQRPKVTGAVTPDRSAMQLRYSFECGLQPSTALSRSAARVGKLPLLRCALANDCPWTEDMCAAAAESGKLDVLQWLREEGCPWDENTCFWAAAEGHLHVLQWARAYGCPWDRYVCSGAARHGHLHVLEWAKANGCSWNEDICMEGVRGGRLDVVKWSRGQGAPWNEILCSRAAGYGHLHILQWARENGAPWNELQLCRSAARKGQLHVLQWARNQGCPWHEDICMEAAKGGHQGVLQWARENGCPWNESTCRGAAAGGHLKTLQWARENGCPWNGDTLIEAEHNGHRDVLVWAREKDCPDDAARVGGHSVLPQQQSQSNREQEQQQQQQQQEYHQQRQLELELKQQRQLQIQRQRQQQQPQRQLHLQQERQQQVQEQQKLLLQGQFQQQPQQGPPEQNQAEQMLTLEQLLLHHPHQLEIMQDMHQQPQSQHVTTVVRQPSPDLGHDAVVWRCVIAYMRIYQNSILQHLPGLLAAAHATMYPNGTCGASVVHERLKRSMQKLNANLAERRQRGDGIVFTPTAVAEVVEEQNQLLLAELALMLGSKLPALATEMHLATGLNNKAVSAWKEMETKVRRFNRASLSRKPASSSGAHASTTQLQLQASRPQNQLQLLQQQQSPTSFSEVIDLTVEALGAIQDVTDSPVPTATTVVPQQLSTYRQTGVWRWLLYHVQTYQARVSSDLPGLIAQAAQARASPTVNVLGAPAIRVQLEQAAKVMNIAIVNYRRRNKAIVYDAATMASVYKAQNRLFSHELTKLGLDLPSLAPFIHLETELKRRAIVANRAVQTKMETVRAAALRSEGGHRSGGVGII